MKLWAELFERLEHLKVGDWRCDMVGLQIDWMLAQTLPCRERRHGRMEYIGNHGNFQNLSDITHLKGFRFAKCLTG